MICHVSLTSTNVQICLFEEIGLHCDLRPNRSVQNDRILILSLSALQQQVGFDMVFTMQIRIIREESLFHSEASEECFSLGVYIPYNMCYLRYQFTVLATGLSIFVRFGVSLDALCRQ